MKVYGKMFRDPEQVLLTVVTTDDKRDDDTSGGFYSRSSFVGGVVSFPLSYDIVDGSNNRNVKVPSRSDIASATLEAFAIPGYGEHFLNDLLEAQHEDLAGLLLVHAKSVEEGDSINNGVDGGLEKVEGTPVATPSTADAGSSEESFSLMDNIWAIAAVAALGAMFLTILMCTTVLWCDWRKRKARKERIREEKLMKAQQSSGDVFNDNLMNIPTLPSEETTELQSPSSDDFVSNNRLSNAGTSRTSIARPSIMSSIRKKSITTTKSKAAETHLQLSRSIDDEDPSPTKSQEAAPSVVYSVGEDTTTMLYPALHRGRQNSRDLSEFDGYSMDGMSAIGVGLDGSSTANGSASKQHPLLAQRNVMYSGEVPRDFDSVWDDESKLTSTERGHERNLSIGSDSILGKSVGEIQPMDKEPIVNLTGLNRLDEDQANSGSGGSKNFLNEFDDGSESENSNRGAFTLELLKGSGKSKRKVVADDDDSILGDIGIRNEYMNVSAAMEDVEEEDSLKEEKDAVVPSSDASVDSSPSWAGRIKSALMRSTSKTALEQTVKDDDSSAGGGVGSSSSAIFRPTAADSASVGADSNSVSSQQKSSPVTSPIETAPSHESHEQTNNAANTSILSHQTSPNSVKDKFVSSLGLSLSFSRNNDDDNSVSSARSARSSSSHRSSHSRNSRASAAASSKSKQPNALGLTNSMDDEVDEDPTDMIENINEMLSECRVILDTDVDAPVK